MRARERVCICVCLTSFNNPRPQCAPLGALDSPLHPPALVSPLPLPAFPVFLLALHWLVLSAAAWLPYSCGHPVKVLDLQGEVSPQVSAESHQLRFRSCQACLWDWFSHPTVLTSARMVVQVQTWFSHGSDTTEALMWDLQNHGSGNGAMIMPYANISLPIRFDHIYWWFERLFLPSSIIKSEVVESLIPARRDVAAGDLSRPPS